jgi:hypothetical protein
MKRPLPRTRRRAERKKFLTIRCALPPSPWVLISCEIFPDEVLAMAYTIKGPFLATAVLCERADRDSDGALTLTRIADGPLLPLGLSWGVIRPSNSAAKAAGLRLMCWSKPVSYPQCLCGRSPLWSAAACCRFGASQLAGWELCPRLKFPQASSRPGKQSRKAGPHSKVSHPHPPFQTGGEKSGLGTRGLGRSWNPPG